MVGHSGWGINLCSCGVGVRDGRCYPRQGEQASRIRDLPNVSYSHPRNTLDARGVLPGWGSNHLEQLSDWFRVEDLVALVYLARMGHCCDTAEAADVSSTRRTAIGRRHMSESNRRSI